MNCAAQVLIQGPNDSGPNSGSSSQMRPTRRRVSGSVTMTSR